MFSVKLTRRHHNLCMVIGNPLKSSPSFPPPHTVRETFISYGVPSRIPPRLGSFAPAAFTTFIATMNPLTAPRLPGDLLPSTSGLSNVPSHLSLTMNTLGPHCTDGRDGKATDPNSPSVPLPIEKGRSSPPATKMIRTQRRQTWIRQLALAFFLGTPHHVLRLRLHLASHPPTTGPGRMQEDQARTNTIGPCDRDSHPANQQNS